MKQLFLTALMAGICLAGCQKKTDGQTTGKPTDTTAAFDQVPEHASDQLYSPDNFVIIPGEQVGNIRGTSTQAELIERLGKENVTADDTIYVAEGETAIGTTLFKGTPDEVQILWLYQKKAAKPDAVILRPASDKPGTGGMQTQWVTDNGLKIGSTLKEVEKLNGKPFKLYGFGWDYGGSASSWEGGKLEGKGGKTYLSIVFGYGDLSAEQEKIVDKVSGDGEFMSSDPGMQQLNPVVQTMTVRFK
ncbi:hypothetical protein [Arsenicibacter rosenii]|uniref:Uncharacterized protein n=1 Tax=Arsenicibacter rosenii TaxID=1750698 RepID=A0A1S2VLQ0_9BACT|nr:hypothetical protein [Arsenicibacter rosenii]OIN59669.1 hypothetical protein BLX24_07305 [Arsenicibacter rosenii]